MENKKLFMKGMKELMLAFGCNLDKDRIDLYYKYLSEKLKTDSHFVNKTKSIILHDDRFPSIARFLRESKEERETREAKQHQPQFLGENNK